MNARELILQADDLQREEVPVPEWGLSVFVRTMTGRERDRFEALHQSMSLDDFRARVALFTVCDSEGRPLFTEADIPALSAKSARALDRIAARAMQLNRITEADVEELAKN